jgi:plastocyanin
MYHFGARRGLVVLVGVGLALSGCGGDDDLEPQAYELIATDYAFEGVPDEVAAGSTLTLTNESTQELHEVVAVRLPDDEQRSADELLSLPMEEMSALMSGVVTVVVAPPGADGYAVQGTGELSEPGRYLLLCSIPTGIDPAEYMAAAQASAGGPPEIEGAGPPHFVHGMYAEIVVED